MKVFLLALSSISFVYGYHNSSLPVQFVKANNDFTIRLYSHVTNYTLGNVVFTSFPVESMLALISLGAKGETQKELETVINLSNKTKNEIKDYFKSVFDNLKEIKEPKFDALDNILVKKGIDLKPEFKQLAETYFHTKFGSFDSKTDAVQKINSLIEKTTSSNSTHLVNEKHVDDTTHFIILSTQFVRGSWKHRFPKSDTYRGDFYNTKTDVAKVEMMKLSAHLLISRDVKYHFRILILPYIHGMAGFFIFLPDDTDGLPLIERNGHDMWQRRQFSRKYVEVHLPKFKIDSIIDMTHSLKNMGITKLISGADLTGILNENLDVSIVAQVAHIEVDEDGTKPPTRERDITENTTRAEEVEVFKVDRPFIFSVMYNDLGLIIGKVNTL
ncbi:hypothetical protein WA026_005625 [Henosepilachna vigintioctopunctata]|uniref:Serpin domain-containing protein n=1 Tax=Henosepilachna vigintioctopunctata TaxID=420089 RepID=A0AAW1U3H2_9CUCU